jgi:hypothetical protein
MWQQQQQGQPQGIPLQQGQYPNYAYNTNVNNNFTQPINSPILTSEKAPEVTIGIVKYGCFYVYKYLYIFVCIFL